MILLGLRSSLGPGWTCCPGPWILYLGRAFPSQRYRARSRPGPGWSM